MNRFFPNYEKYKVTSPYGMRVLRGITKMHNGIDLVAMQSNGQSAVDVITAHTGGVVAQTGYTDVVGKYAIIQTERNVTMHYYHLNNIYVKKGDSVSRGQRIGYMGSTGNSTGAHLHFGIKNSGKWINPTKYLDKAYYGGNMVSVEMKVLKQGHKNEQVKILQALLNEQGASLSIDGSFGMRTKTALENYQRQNNLSVEGVCGRQTWNSLLKA